MTFPYEGRPSLSPPPKPVLVHWVRVRMMGKMRMMMMMVQIN